MPNGASSQASGAPWRVQDCLWGVDKAHNRRVPVTVQAYSASTERARKLAEEAAASPYRTVEQVGRGMLVPHVLMPGCCPPLV